MNNSTTINKKTITAKTLTIFIAVAGAVILPQIFHAVGTISGTGSAIGSAFLPMHIPVLLAGLVGGVGVGVIAGILSPLLSFAISGMPTAMLLPFIVIELGIYGLVSGILSKSKLNAFVKLLITQISGRIARAGAVLFAIYALGNEKLTVASIGTFIVTGLFGIILQWALIPLLADKMEDLKKFYE